jgi:hypothetical protein
MSAYQTQNYNQCANKWNNSVFIPSIDFNITKNQIKEIMEEHFGRISRIDFVSFNSDNGSGRRAFIHFSEWFKNPYANGVRGNIEINGFHDMLLSLPNNNKYKVRLLVNKNPVPETEQTIQQVASNMDFMAEKIRIQEEEIQGLKQLCHNLIFHTQQMELRMNAILARNDAFLREYPSVVEDDIMGEMNVSELY